MTSAARLSVRPTSGNYASGKYPIPFRCDETAEVGRVKEVEGCLVIDKKWICRRILEDQVIGEHYTLQLSRTSQALPVVYWDEWSNCPGKLVRPGNTDLQAAIRKLREQGRPLSVLEKDTKIPYMWILSAFTSQKAYALVFTAKDGWGRTIRLKPDPSADSLNKEGCPQTYYIPEEEAPYTTLPRYRRKPDARETLRGIFCTPCREDPPRNLGLNDSLRNARGEGPPRYPGRDNPERRSTNL